MFFFKKKKPKVKELEDSIWLSKAMRYKGVYEACLRKQQKQRIVLIATFFKESLNEVKFIFDHKKLAFTNLDYNISGERLQVGQIYLVEVRWLQEVFLKKATEYLSNPITILFPEHYPIPKPENDLLESLGALDWQDAECQFYDSLDSDLMQLFGSERIQRLMGQLGMASDEEISHKMISRSLRRAQESVASKIGAEQKADSIEEWMKKNMKNA